MARSSRSKGSVSVDLFNLPTLPDERRVATSYLDIPVDFYLPDGKNSKISKIVTRQAFDRQTPDGNEGFVIEIQYLKRAFGTNTYLIDKVTGSLFALHDDHIESTGLCGSECVFDLQELEFHICDLADQRNGEDDTGSVAGERQTTHRPQTPDAPPSPGPPMIPDDFPMYEEWENLTHQEVAFTIAYRQQIYEIRSEIITTLIDCFSELNKHMKSHPETEVACHQEKAHHFSYYSWLIQHIDNVLQEDNVFRCSKELPELPAPTYSPSVNDLEMIHRIHVMSHAWRESDHALQEATIIHREFMLDKAHMNNTSFSRIRNITDMGYSLNRVSPILGEQQTPAQSANPRNPTSTPRQKSKHVNNNPIASQGADKQHEGRASPYDPDRSVENHLQGEAAGPDYETQGAQAPTTNNMRIPFQNPPRCVPSTTGSTGQSNNRYSQPPNKGPGKKASNHINTQPSLSAIFSQVSSYPQSRNLGTGHPKLFCTACGGYDHWRKDCPYDCHCDNCDSDSHATHMCRAPPKPSPTPSPQPVICVYCGSSEHRSMECNNHPRDNREEGRVPNPASSRYSRDKQQKSAIASSEISQKSNGRSRNNDKPRTSGENPQRPVTGRQQPQPSTQGKRNNNNSFPYRDYRYHDQPRQTRFNEKQNQMYSPYHFAPSPALSAGSDLLSHSIMQLAETQSHSLEIFAAQQKSQIDVYQELTRSNKEKEHDALFTSIPVFDGDRTQCEQWLDDMDQATRISGRDLRTELIKKSTGVVRQVIMMAHPDASDDDLINIIREDFSDAPTMNEAREELLHMRQKPEEQMHVYIYRYGRMHQRSSGIRAAEETHQHVIQDFIKSLKPKIKNKFANKFAEGRFQPRTLDHAFSLALDLEKKIQIADSFRDDIMDSRTPAMVNEVQSHPLDESRAINEISSNSSYRNNNAKGNYSGKPWHQKGDNRSWQNRDNKWQNKDSKSWQNKDKKPWQNNKNKSDKPRDTCFTLSQDQKFFVPADCDENVFQIICTLVKVQIDKAKQSGGNTKEINEISKDTLVNLLNISDETYDAAQSAVQQVKKDEILSSSSSTD